MRKRGIEVLLCEANARVLAKLRKAGVLSEATSVGYTDQLIEAIRRVQTVSEPVATHV